MKKKEQYGLKKWMIKNKVKVNELSKKVQLSSPHLSCFRSHHKTPSLLNALKIWYACNKEFELEDLLDPKRMESLEIFKKEIKSHE